MSPCYTLLAQEDRPMFDHQFQLRVLELLRELNQRTYTMALDLTKLTIQEQRLVADVDTLLASSAAAQASLATLQGQVTAGASDPTLQASIDAIAAALSAEAAKVEGPGGTLGPASGPVPPTVPGPNQTTVLAAPASGGVGTQYVTGATGNVGLTPGVVAVPGVVPGVSVLATAPNATGNAGLAPGSTGPFGPTGPYGPTLA